MYHKFCHPTIPLTPVAATIAQRHGSLLWKPGFQGTCALLCASSLATSCQCPFFIPSLSPIYSVFKFWWTPRLWTQSLPGHQQFLSFPTICAEALKLKYPPELQHLIYLTSTLVYLMDNSNRACSKPSWPFPHSAPDTFHLTKQKRFSQMLWNFFSDLSFGSIRKCGWLNT